MFTLFPPQYGHLSIAETDTERGIARDLDLVPRTIVRVWDAEAGTMSTQLTFEAASYPELATNGDVPGVIESGEIVNPPIESVIIPPLPIVILPPGEGSTERPKTLILASTLGVFYTENADAESVADIEWAPMNDGLTEDEYTQINNMFVTPDGKVWVHSIHGSGSIHVAAGLGWPFVTLVTGNDLGTGFEIAAMGHNPFESCKVMFSAGLNDAFDIYETNGDSYAAKGHTIHYRRDWWGMHAQCIFFVGGRWLHIGNITGVFSSPWYVVFNYDCSAGLSSADMTTAVGQDSTYRRATPVGTQDVWFQWDGSGAGRYNKGTATDPFTHARSAAAYPNPRGAQGVAASPTGTVIMASDVGMGTPYKSTDGGDTWTSMGGTMPTGTGVVENCGDDTRFIFAGGTAVRFTPDVGDTYEDLSGNLSYIAPLIDITILRFIE